MTEPDWNKIVLDQDNWHPVQFTPSSPLAMRNGCPYTIVIQGDIFFCEGKIRHYGDHSLNVVATRGKPNLVFKRDHR